MVLGFARELLDAPRRPHAVLLEQNIQSQMVPTENATTGTAVAEELRAGGYEGVIIIRSANVSRAGMREYKAAGADVVMSKDEQRDSLLRLLVLHGAADGAKQAAGAEEVSSVQMVESTCSEAGEGRGEQCDTLPLVDWPRMLAISGRGAEDTFACFRTSCHDSTRMLTNALEQGMACGLLLHTLAGSCAAAGAQRLGQLALQCEQEAATFGPAALGELEALVTATLAEIDERSPTLSAPPSSSSHTGKLHALHAPSTSTAAADSTTAYPLFPWLLHSASAKASPRNSIPPLAASSATEGKKRASRSTPLVCAGIDDSPLPQQMMEVLFQAIGADMTRSRAIGTSREEQLGFVDYVLGAVDSQLAPLPMPHRQVDIALLDQHILLDGEQQVLGSELVVQLRERGFTGVVCLISGGSAEAAAQLRTLPGVDMASPKNFEPILLARCGTAVRSKCGVAVRSRC